VSSSRTTPNHTPADFYQKKWGELGGKKGFKRIIRVLSFGRNQKESGVREGVENPINAASRISFERLIGQIGPKGAHKKTKKKKKELERN